MYISPKGEYPRYYGDIQLEHPNWKLGDELPKGWVQVAEVEQPETKENEIAYVANPEIVDGVMTQQWKIREMTAEEIERRDAPKRAKEKLMALGLSEVEIEALVRGLI